VQAQKVEQAGASPAMSEKQKKLLDDSEKLVQMAAELKVSVDKSNKNELSLDVVRKAEAVEKLAKSLKERIREAR
jgi:nitric oxide reductase activation protein